MDLRHDFLLPTKKKKYEFKFIDNPLIHAGLEKIKLYCQSWTINKKFNWTGTKIWFEWD